MDIIQKTIPHIFRNKYLRETGGNYISSRNNNNNNFTGSYLPATQDSEGNWTVDLTKVNFTGDIMAEGEITAFKNGTEQENPIYIEIVDNLISTSSTSALSANQGRILKELIDNIPQGTGNADITEIENRFSQTVGIGLGNTLSNGNTINSELNSINKLLANKSDINHAHSQYLTAIPSEYITNTELSAELSNKADINHIHNYLPLTGGTLTGDINIGGVVDATTVQG